MQKLKLSSKRFSIGKSARWSEMVGKSSQEVWKVYFLVGGSIGSYFMSIEWVSINAWKLSQCRKDKGYFARSWGFLESYFCHELITFFLLVTYRLYFWAQCLIETSTLVPQSHFNYKDHRKRMALHI